MYMEGNKLYCKLMHTTCIAYTCRLQWHTSYEWYFKCVDSGCRYLLMRVRSVEAGCRSIVALRSLMSILQQLYSTLRLQRDHMSVQTIIKSQ